MTLECRGPLIDTVNEIEIIDCSKCDFKHAIIDFDLSEIYTSHYYESNKPSYISTSESDSQWWDLTYGERIKKLESLSRLPILKYLDIGSGPGLFLDALKLRDKIGVGIEPSEQAYNYSVAKGHNVINSHFDLNLAKQLGQFDAVHLSEVLEHVPNPIDFLNSVKEVTRIGGVICVVVPNDYNPIQEVFVKNTTESRWWVAPPFHLNYFDKPSLEKLLVKTGFEIRYSTVMFPIDFFLLMGDNYIGNDEVGRAAHQRRKNFENSFRLADSLEIMHKLYDSLAQIGLGRELVVFARRKE